MDIQIKTQGLTKQYKMGTQTVDALNGIDLEIEKGSFTAVCGTSGSGKSTLLHMLGCLDRPSSGDVFIGDIKVTETKDKKLSKIRRENIGFVFQRFCLIPELSVTENIIVPVLLSGKRPDTAYIDELCDILGLSDRKGHLPSELSGGQQQRCAIARALANDPQIVLCDEPTGNLDPGQSAEIIRLLDIIHDHGITVIMATHDMSVFKDRSHNPPMEDIEISNSINVD